MKLIASLLALMLALATVQARAEEANLLRLGTNLVTGLYYPAGGAICRMLVKGRETHGLRCLVESTNGSTANIRALRAGELEFAIVQSDWQFHAVRGNGIFRPGGQQGGPVKDLRAVFALQAEAFTVIVRADSAFQRFDQLRGKRVNAGDEGAGQRILFDALIAASGLQAGDFTLSEMDADEQARALCEGRIDAAILMTSHPAMNVIGLRAACAVRFLAVDGEAVAKVTKDRPYYAAAIIPAATYGLDKDVATLGVRATLVTMASVSPDVVYTLVKSVFERLEDFTAMHPGLAGLRSEDMIAAGLTAPLHEGALRYFREAGLVK